MITTTSCNIYYASTQFSLSGVISLARSDLNVKKVLIYSKNSDIPELEIDVIKDIAWSKLLNEIFDKVILLNDLIYPTHPSKLTKKEIHILESVIKSDLGVRFVKTFYCESIQASPARALSEAFATCEIVVVSEGLMSYGPTRFNLPKGILNRVTTVHYSDILPEVAPLLLCEAEPDYISHPISCSFEVLESVYKEQLEELEFESNSIFYIGQYLSASGIISEQEEVDIISKTLTHLLSISEGRTVYFKPHPKFSPSMLSLVYNAVNKVLPNDFKVVNGDLPVELVVKKANADLVCGCFSTSLVTISSYFNTHVCTYHLKPVLQKLKVLQNSNRIPMVLICEKFHDESGDSSSFSELISKVSEYRSSNTLSNVMLWVSSLMHPTRFDTKDFNFDSIANKELYYSNVHDLSRVQKNNKIKQSIFRKYRTVVPYGVRSFIGDSRRIIKKSYNE